MSYLDIQSQEVLDQHTRRVSTRPVVRNERQTKANIWFFDSPKNNRRSIISSDLSFMHAVLMEGDVHVASYQMAPDPFVIQDSGTSKFIHVGARVKLRNGTEQWLDFRRVEGLSPSKRQALLKADEMEQQALAFGVSYHIRTDLELRGQEIVFDNWLTLCAAITRCRNQTLARERQAFSQHLARQGAISLADLIEIEGIDIACMTAVIAISLQQGITNTNLSTQLFGLASIIQRSDQ